MKAVLAALILCLLFTNPAEAGFECKRVKNSEGEVVTKCSQNEEKQIKVIVTGDEPKSVFAEERPDDRAPPELVEEISKYNDASMLDWPCSSDRAPDVLMPAKLEGVRRIGISGTYHSDSCGAVSVAFPTGMGTVALSCDKVKVRASGKASLCVTAETAYSDDLGITQGMVYLRGATPSSTLELEMDENSKRPLQLVVEGFGRFGRMKEFNGSGQIRIKGSAGGTTHLESFMMLSGSLSLENVTVGRLTTLPGVRLYMKNSTIRYLRWAGKRIKKKWDYLGPLQAK